MLDKYSHLSIEKQLDIAGAVIRSMAFEIGQHRHPESKQPYYWASQILQQFLDKEASRGV